MSVAAGRRSAGGKGKRRGSGKARSLCTICIAKLDKVGQSVNIETKGDF